MERMSLREASARTSLSITTLRRYIRSGRLHAEKLQGRFGPEYFVSPRDLESAGIEPLDGPPAEAVTAIAMPAATAIERAFRESVPLALFQELQMKHEQLLVQYGMMRAGGLRSLGLQAELDARRGQVDEARAETARLRDRLAREGTELRRRARESELEIEGLRLENAALREKVRALEMLTRNAVTSESIERQWDRVVEQSRKVDRLISGQDLPPAAPAPAGLEPEH
jgi:lambda repressor-like predicted transcriptional regulator